MQFFDDAVLIVTLLGRLRDLDGSAGAEACGCTRTGKKKFVRGGGQIEEERGGWSQGEREGIEQNGKLKLKLQGSQDQVKINYDIFEILFFLMQQF